MKRLIDTGRPNVVAVVYGDAPACLELAGAAAAAGADVIECRADLLADDVDLATLLPALRDATPLPLLLTVRDRIEGGRFAGTQDDRVALFQAHAAAVDAIDIEVRAAIAATVVALAVDRGVQSVASFHDFEATPGGERLEQLLQQAQDLGATIFKAAVTASQPADLGTLLNFTDQHRAIPTATMAMGDLGGYSRALAPLLGSCLTYGFVGSDKASVVPGQLPVAELRAWIDDQQGETWTLKHALALVNDVTAQSAPHDDAIAALRQAIMDRHPTIH